MTLRLALVLLLSTLTAPAVAEAQATGEKATGEPAGEKAADEKAAGEKATGEPAGEKAAEPTGEKAAPGGQAASAGEKASGQPADPMAAWKPPKVKNEAADRKEIAALFKTMDEAGKKGDLEAAAALVDFPVLMLTDDSKGQGMGQTWSKEQWTKVMEPFYAKPMKMTVTHKPTIVLLSDSLASATDSWTMTMGQKKVAGKSATLLIRRDGQWRVKAMMEGGWGDMPMPTASAETK